MNMVEKLTNKLFGEQKEDTFEFFSSVDYRLVAHKIIEQVQNSPNYNFYPFACSRLSKLVLLADIKFRQQHNKPLIRDQYQCYDLNGVVLNDVYDDYKMMNDGSIISTTPSDYVHESYEKCVGKKISSGIDKLVKEIVKMTEYVDIQTLRKLTENGCGDCLLEWKKNHTYEDKIPHEMISAWYENFDFNKVIEINNSNKKEFSSVNN